MTQVTTSQLITTIDNNQRVFAIFGQGWSSFKIFCNLNDLVNCCKSIEKNEPFKIYHFWNNQMKPLGRKYLAELMEANQRPDDANYFKNLKNWSN